MRGGLAMPVPAGAPEKGVSFHSLSSRQKPRPSLSFVSIAPGPSSGILARSPDAHDGRRSLVSLTPEVAHRLRAYFAEGAE